VRTWDLELEGRRPRMREGEVVGLDPGLEGRRLGLGCKGEALREGLGSLWRASLQGERGERLEPRKGRPFRGLGLVQGGRKG
jgi:hypothetical protein